MTKGARYLLLSTLALSFILPIFSRISRAEPHYNLDSEKAGGSMLVYSENSDVNPNDDVCFYVETGEMNKPEFIAGTIENQNRPFLPRDYLLEIYPHQKIYGKSLKAKIWKADENKEYFAAISPADIMFELDSWQRVDLSLRNRTFTNIEDLEKFTSWWLRPCNTENNYCDYFDVDKNGIENNIDFAYFANSWRGESGNLADLAEFASNWLRNDCTESNGYCDNFDANQDGKVNFADFADFAASWGQ